MEAACQDKGRQLLLPPESRGSDIGNFHPFFPHGSSLTPENLFLLGRVLQLILWNGFLRGVEDLQEEQTECLQMLKVWWLAGNQTNRLCCNTMSEW